MKKPPQTLRVRVSTEGDGYREAKRASTVELDATTREVADEAAWNRLVERKARGARRVVSIIAASPVLLATTILHLQNAPADLLVIFYLITALVAATTHFIQWLRPHPMVKSVAANTPKPMRTITRRPQKLVLVGDAARDAGHERTLTRVRVMATTEEGRVKVVGEYEDGSSSQLLYDVAADEVDVLRDCLAAHEIPLT